MDGQLNFKALDEQEREDAADGKKKEEKVGNLGQIYGPPTDLKEAPVANVTQKANAKA